MKQFLLLLLPISLFAVFANAQNINFPDPNFKAALLNNVNIYDQPAPIDTNSDGEISIAEAEAYTEFMTVIGKDISDLTGIEYFKNITGLYASNNPISVVNLSNNTEITHLLLNECPNLTTLNLTNNNKLTAISAMNCLVGPSSPSELVLDLSGNSALENLFLSGSKVKTLDVSHNPLLKRLLIESNPISSIDLTNLTVLEELWCSDTDLTNLNIASNVNLTTLIAQEVKFANLDLSKNTMLQTLSLKNNNLNSIDLSKNVNLLDLSITINNLEHIDISQCSSIEMVELAVNHIKELDLSMLENLNYVDLTSNRLTRFNLANGGNGNISFMSCEENPDLQCVKIDEGFDVNAAIANGANWYYDNGTTLSADCEGVGISENPPLNISLYPNPVENELFIQNIESENGCHLIIYDLSGKRIDEISHKNSIRVDKLPKGSYILKIITDNDVRVAKFIKN